jgi:hypothetical protein
MQMIQSVDWAAVAGGGSIIASLATLIVVAFNGGRLAQKVADHDDKFIEQAKTNTYVNDKISEHGNQLSRLEGIDLATRKQAEQ